MPVQADQILSTLLINLTLSLIVLGLIWINTRFTKFSLFETVYAFSLFWIFLIVGTQWILDYQLTINSLLLLYSIPILFNLVQFIIRLLVINIPKDSVITNTLFNWNKARLIINALFILCILSNLLWIYNQYYQKGIELVALEQIRSATIRNNNDEPNLFYNLFGRIYLLLIPWCYQLYKLQVWNSKKLITILFISILLSAVQLTRAPILIVFIYILLCNGFFLGGKKAIRLNLVLVLFAFSLFAIITLMIDSATISSIPLISTGKLYLFGGMAAFQKVLEGSPIADPLVGNYYYSLDFLFYIEKKLGLIKEYPSYIRPYTDFGSLSTNVYTFLDCYFMDWGIVGVLVGTTILFSLGSMINQLSNATESIFFFQLHALFFSNLMMCFMNNEFIRISFFILAGEIMLCYYLFTKKTVPQEWILSESLS